MAKIFVSGTRPLKWKNKERLRQAFARAGQSNPDLVLDDENVGYEQFLDKIKNAYAVILVSLGDISPNLILDAIRANKPFVLTRENGLENRLIGVGLRCNPEDELDIAKKILELAEPETYQAEVEKIRALSLKHDWSDIAVEFLALAKNL